LHEVIMQAATTIHNGLAWPRRRNLARGRGRVLESLCIDGCLIEKTEKAEKPAKATAARSSRRWVLYGFL
jgi:hypothetical protein